jgi:hypothetical protein
MKREKKTHNFRQQSLDGDCMKQSESVYITFIIVETITIYNSQFNCEKTSHI